MHFHEYHEFKKTQSVFNHYQTLFLSSFSSSLSSLNFFSGKKKKNKKNSINYSMVWFWFRFLIEPEKRFFFWVQGLLFEEKTRLGSTPPSCHNKCNQCHPCMAVQVPTIPSHETVQSGLTVTISPMQVFFEPSPQGNNNKYSNYKPLGWKCRCGNHFFNP